MTLQRRTLKKAKAHDDLIELDPTAPLKTAKIFVALKYSKDKTKILRHYRKAFYVWRTTDYRQISSANINKQLWEFLEKSYVMGGKGVPKPFNPTQTKVSGVTKALIAHTQLNDDKEIPYWITKSATQPKRPISTYNGLLDIKDRKLYPHSPHYFNQSYVRYSFDPDAPAPKRWMQFLDEVFQNDTESKETLQEIFGYLLTKDTSQQKMFLLIGPRRAGKGTIARVLTSLLGTDLVDAPTLSTFSDKFGLQGLIGRQLAIVSDVRLGKQTNHALITERLLAISGEDKQSIRRMYTPERWRGKLDTRFLFLTNEIPKLQDASLALVGRFIPIKTDFSAFGREDRKLINKLRKELAGILNWSLEGLDRLNERGHFVIPEAAKELLVQMERLASPISDFVKERCVLSPDGKAVCDDLLAAFNEYRKGRKEPTMEMNVFSVGLHAAFPSIKTKGGNRKLARLRDKERVRTFDGIALVE